MDFVAWILGAGIVFLAIGLVLRRLMKPDRADGIVPACMVCGGMLLWVAVCILGASAAFGRDLDGRFAQSPSFKTKNLMNRPSPVKSVMDRSFGDSELLSPFVKVLLDATERDLDAVGSVVRLVGAQNPFAIVRSVIPVVVASLNGKARFVSRSHILVKASERHPTITYFDASPAIPRIPGIVRVGAPSDHAKPNRNHRMSFLAGQAEQSTGDKAPSFGIFHFSIPVRNDGRYANSPLHDWFDSLKSGRGPCCSDADGFAISDPDWSMDHGHYRVRISGEWYDVPDDAVITEPNLAGKAMVWPMYIYEGGEAKSFRGIRCFMPGAQI